MLNETITTALNNPECSILTGILIGNIASIKNVFIMFSIYYLFKTVDKISITPLINYIKKRRQLNNQKGEQQEGGEQE